MVFLQNNDEELLAVKVSVPRRCITKKQQEKDENITVYLRAVAELVGSSSLPRETTFCFPIKQLRPAAEKPSREEGQMWTRLVKDEKRSSPSSLSKCSTHWCPPSFQALFVSLRVPPSARATLPSTVSSLAAGGVPSSDPSSPSSIGPHTNWAAVIPMMCF